MSEGSKPGRPKRLPPRRRHETLDSQLIPYWEREAARFDALAQSALFGWLARGYARRAERARGLAEASRAREIARGRAPGPPEAEASAAGPA